MSNLIDALPPDHAAGRPPLPVAPAASAAPPVSQHPLIGTAAVLIGSIISTLNGRLTTFGLADVEGAIHAGFDEGAWITTAFTVGQMLIAPAAVWLSLVVGSRRILLVACAIFTVSNLCLPFSPSLGWVLFFQLVSGLSSGTFIPLTLGFVLLNLPARWVVYGVAVYTMNLELSLNISASIEGFFDAHGAWPGIFWDTAALGPVMIACILIGVPRQPVNRAMLGAADWAGILYISTGLSFIYAALDQGNRLDWLNSNLVDALLLGGTILMVAFVIRELTAPRPWLDLRFALTGNLPLLGSYIAFFRSVILSTSYIIPQYLITVQGFRSLEVGSVLIWIAAPQFVLAPIAGWILSRIDPRIVMAIGFTLIGAACLIAAQLTDDWAGVNFLPSQIMQAVGQTFALSAIVWFVLLHLDVTQIPTFGAVLQSARLFGSELGSAFVQTFIRMREQTHSNLVGQHVVAGSGSTVDRIAGYAHALGSRSIGEPSALGRGTALLAAAVRKQAYVLAYIDGFTVLGLAVIVALVMILILRSPPENSVLNLRLKAARARAAEVPRA